VRLLGGIWNTVEFYISSVVQSTALLLASERGSETAMKCRRRAALPGASAGLFDDITPELAFA